MTVSSLCYFSLTADRLAGEGLLVLLLLDRPI
jgi:hypothetical protein